jgi:hypothetical protein
MPRSAATLPESRPASPVTRLTVGLCCGLLSAIIVIILRAHIQVQPMGAFEDDFYYYTGMARGYLETGFTTFDHTSHTNGYHPIWQFIIILLLKFLPEHLLLAVSLLMLVSSVGSFLLTLRLLRPYNLPNALGPIIAAATAAYAWSTTHGAMESNLGIPALLLIAIYAQEHEFRLAKEWAILGCLISFAILSRLDIFIFAFLLCFALALKTLLAVQSGGESPAKPAASALAALAAGMIPVFLYFAYNYITFGEFLTVSAHAKQLKAGLAPDHDVLDAYWLNSLLRFSYGITLIALLAYVASSLKRLWSQPVLIASLTFPFLHMAALAMRSEYALRPWYEYPAALSLPLALAYLWRRFLPARAVPDAAGLLALLVLAGGIAKVEYFTLKPPQDLLTLFDQDIALNEWFKTHPGKVAMGDRAGVLGSLRPDGLVQLEGLTMDEAFVKEMRERKNLIAVLLERHVRYYVSQVPQPVGNGCYAMLEPNRVGPKSPTMLATLCEKPLFTIQDPTLAKKTDPFFLGVFDLDGIAQRPDGTWGR